MHTLRLLHRWVGLVLALILAVVAVTGGLLLLRGPYDRARYPMLAQPVTAAEITKQGDVIASIEGRFRGEELRNIKLPRPGRNAFQVWLGEHDEALIDPRTGDLIARWSWHTDLPAFVFELHAHLLAGDPGSTINGIAALFAVFLALTGLILWWPARASAYRLRRAWPRSGSASELLRSHAATGALALVPILLFAGTGAAIIFYTPFTNVMSAMMDAQAPERPRAVVARRTDTPQQPWSTMLAGVRSAVPDGEVVFVSPGRGANAAATFRLRRTGEWHPNGRSYVLVNPYDASILQSIDARAQGAGTRVAYMLYPLHAATVGGTPYLLFTACGAIGLAWLGVGGLAAWLRKWRQTRRSRQQRESRAAAARPAA